MTNMIKIFSAQDKVFPMPLYHGTDKRLIEMGHENVLFLHVQCQRIYPVLLSLMRQELSIVDLGNCSVWHRAMKEHPKEEQDKLERIYSYSIHPLLLKDRGNGKYQYGSFYVTLSSSAAARYADTAYCGGEFCDIVYELTSVFNSVWPGLFKPDENMQKAIETMDHLAKGARHPIVYEFNGVSCDCLLTESGDPISSVYQEGDDLDPLDETDFRYNGPVDFNALKVQREEIKRKIG